MPEIPEDLLRLAAQHVHWTYHRRSACQCEDAGSDEHDVEQARQIIEALWPVAYRAGREDAARDALVIRGDLDVTTVIAALDRVESGVGDLARAARDLLRRLPTWMGSDGRYRLAGPGQADQPTPERCPECAELGHSSCYEAGLRAGRESAAPGPPIEAVRALCVLWDTWWNKVDAYDPGRVLICDGTPLTGIASLIGAEGGAAMEQACDAVEPYEAAIAAFLAGKNLVQPAEEQEGREP